MTEPNTDESRRIILAKRAWVAITAIQSTMHNERIKDGHLVHWEVLVMYLDRAARSAENLERTTDTMRDSEGASYVEKQN